MTFGAEPVPAGIRFRLWAPGARRVVLRATVHGVEQLQVDMCQCAGGWYQHLLRDAGAGARYCYRIDDEVDVPDPASRFNPDGIEAPAEVIDPRGFEWGDDAWRGREWHETVLYEMHIGTFTREGTYAAAAARLGELAELGITAIELMPVAAFAGRRGWGYDGVLPYAPHSAYGRPEDLKRFVQAAHEHGLMVLLDVVYNHFGPQGNYLARYAPEFFAPERHTAWGAAIDYDRHFVRRFFIENALYWLEEFHFDGLRIDAVHVMHDQRETHFIDELIDAVQHGPGRNRHAHIVLENHLNQAHRLGRKSHGFVSQWNDDFHHAMHVIATGERDGYYSDYVDAPVAHLGRVLAEGFAYQGERSQFTGIARGEPSANLPPIAFVNFLQNHDQVGNRARGERLAALSAPQARRAALAILLLAPQIPMLFMGQEYAANQPFLFFCDYQGDLASAVREGRRTEFAAFPAFAAEEQLATIPDPNDEATFIASQLDPADQARSPHAEWLSYVRELLQIRAHRLIALLPEMLQGQSTYTARGRVIAVQWPTRTGSTLVMYANLDDAPAEPPMAVEGELLFSTHPESDAVLVPCQVRLLLAHP